MARPHAGWLVLGMLVCSGHAGYAQPPAFPTNFRQVQTTDSLDRGPVASPDEVALKRLLIRPPAPEPVKQPDPDPNFFGRLVDFNGVQNSLSQEEKLAVGMSLSYFFERRRELYREWNRNLQWLNEASNALFTFGDFKTGIGISMVPFLFGDNEVAEAAMEATFVAGVRVNIVKSVTGIERPLTTPPHAGPTVEQFNNNFPSGHSATVWAWATVLGNAYDIEWLTYPVASLMAISLIARYNTHDFADILAGSMIGHQTGLESLRARGMLEARTFEAGPLEVQTDIGMETLSDSNPALVPGGSPDQGVGRLICRTRASYLVEDDVLMSARYDTARRVYNSLPGNDQDHTFLEFRLDGAPTENVLLGATLFRDRVNFTELGPYSKVVAPATAFSTDPLFSNAALVDVRHSGADLHAVGMPAEGWNVTAHLAYTADDYRPDPGLSGHTVAFSVGGGTLLNEHDEGFQVNFGGGRSSATTAFDKNFLAGNVLGRVALTQRDNLDLGLTLGRDSYPGRGTWNEDYKALTAQYSHRFGEDIWAWVGYSFEDRNAPAAGYTRSQPFFRLNGSF